MGLTSDLYPLELPCLPGSEARVGAPVQTRGLKLRGAFPGPTIGLCPCPLRPPAGSTGRGGEGAALDIEEGLPQGSLELTFSEMGSPHPAPELWGTALAGKGPVPSLHMVVLRERSASFSLVAECLGLAGVLC